MIASQSLLLSLLGFATASTRLAPLAKRACGETADLVCYSESQNLDPADIEYAAAYLRYLASNSGDNPLWTMPPGFDCEEWGLPLFGAATVLGLAKHINPRTNSSVTYTDIAATLDGGENATKEQRAASLLGKCGEKGGQVTVTVNPDDPAYSNPSYVSSGAKPKDIIIKLVRDPSWEG
ncbi:hypothetical protein LIA77_05503 [Sarocladium implicatum]|nr:hypothetical protein LIA77_05503 [Sarocladium implicatum]